jgi:hypothetical protein
MMRQFCFSLLDIPLLSEGVILGAHPIILPIITALAGSLWGYYMAVVKIKLERREDFQKKLAEEQILAHKKLYAAAKHVSIRKENPFALAFKQVGKYC